jgi:hypothetical protein
MHKLLLYITILFLISLVKITSSLILGILFLDKNNFGTFEFVIKYIGVIKK